MTSPESASLLQIAEMFEQANMADIYVWEESRTDLHRAHQLERYDLNEDERATIAAALRSFALAQCSREAVIEECAALCDGLRRRDYSGENEDWIAGTSDCATAIRALSVDEFASAIFSPDRDNNDA